MAIISDPLELTRYKIPAWCKDCEFTRFDNFEQFYCPFNKCEDSDGCAEFRKEHPGLKIAKVFELYTEQLYGNQN